MAPLDNAVPSRITLAMPQRSRRLAETACATRQRVTDRSSPRLFAPCDGSKTETIDQRTNGPGRRPLALNRESPAHLKRQCKGGAEQLFFLCQSKECRCDETESSGLAPDRADMGLGLILQRQLKRPVCGYRFGFAPVRSATRRCYHASPTATVPAIADASSRRLHQHLRQGKLRRVISWFRLRNHLRRLWDLVDAGIIQHCLHCAASSSAGRNNKLLHCLWRRMRPEVFSRPPICTTRWRTFQLSSGTWIESSNGPVEIGVCSQCIKLILNRADQPVARRHTNR